MKRMIVPAILAAAVLAFSLVGCGPQAQTITDENLKGVWALDSGSELGFDAYINFGDDQTVEMIVADGWLNGTYSISGTSATITFDSLDMEALEDEEAELSDTAEGSSSSSASASASGSSSASASASGSSSASKAKTAKLTMSNNKLTLGSDNGSKLVFAKDNSEEAKSMFSYDMSDMDGLDMDGADDVKYVEEVIEDINPVTVADDDKFTITVTGKGTDYTGDPCYRLSMTNKTGKAVYVIPEDTFKVGGKDVEAGLGDELEAGATVETEMYFAQDELGGGLELLTTVDGSIQVLDNETDEEIAKYTFHME